MVYGRLGTHFDRDCDCFEDLYQVGTKYGFDDCFAAVRGDAWRIFARRADEARESARRDDWDGGRSHGDVVCLAANTARLDVVRFDGNDHLFERWLCRQLNRRAHEISDD